MKDFLFLCKEVGRGMSVTRALLNARLAKEPLKGKIIDIGGGKNADYIDFMKREGSVSFEILDVKVGVQIDFEKDSLPAADNTFDTIIFLNVLEHIFNHQHITNELTRVLKPGGTTIGFVPFLMWYHADHRDFFRYTYEALQIILERSGAKDIKIEPIAYGPFTAASQMVTQILPRPVALPLFAFNYLLDSLFLKMRPAQRGRYALGYYFIATK